MRESVMSNNRIEQFLSRTRSKLDQFRTNVRGNVAITAVICLIPIAMATTAAVDFANANRMEASLQAAVDSAVLAAATAQTSGESQAKQKEIAELAFQANLSPNLLEGFSGAVQTNVTFPDKQVHMTATAETNQLVTRLIADSMTINVEAAAQIEEGSDFCILVLNHTAWKALDVQGTSQLKSEDCSVHVNSSHEEGIRQAGTSSAVAESFCVRGNYSGSNFTPMPRPYCRRELDPLANQFAADMAKHDLTTCKLNVLSTIMADTALTPGVYCGGLTIKQGIVTLAPGLYVIRDGELSIEAQATLIGAGVTFLLTGNSNTRFANMAGANIRISPPTSGDFAGITIAQDPATIPSKPDVIRGGGTVDMEGILYFPKQPLVISGSGVIGAGVAQFAIFADTLSVEGNGVLELRFNAALASALPPLPKADEVIRLIK